MAFWRVSDWWMVSCDVSRGCGVHAAFNNDFSESASGEPASDCRGCSMCNNGWKGIAYVALLPGPCLCVLICRDRCANFRDFVLSICK